MDYSVFKDELKNKVKKINIEITDTQVQKFYNYMNLLITWNDKINLTSIIEPSQIIQKHFLDSIIVNKYLKNTKKIIDIGTGAGFPGVPIAIVNESINITLMDSLNKRIIYLQEVIKELNLQNVYAIHSRAEDLGRNVKYRDKYDIVISRAVAKLNVLVEYMLPFVNLGGKCICMKGDIEENEIEEAKKAIKLLGGKINSVDKYDLPDTGDKRAIVIIEKIDVTHKNYPRKAGVPSKSPL